MKNQKSMMRQSAACYAENFQLPVFPCRGEETSHGARMQGCVNGQGQNQQLVGLRGA